MKNSKQSGFTIIEMLIATTVASALLILIMNFMANTLVSNSVESARSDLLREAQLTLDSMGREIRLSANVDESNRWEDVNSPDAVATNGYGWESDADTLILAISAVDEDNAIIFSDATHYITYKNNSVYYIENNTLYKRTIAGDTVPDNTAETSCPAALANDTCRPDVKLAENVDSFSVKYLDSLNNEVSPPQARSVELTLNLSTEKYDRTINANYTTRTVFRNE